MVKNSKGITLIALVITIAILAIIGSIATYSGISTLKYTRFQNAKAQFETMQAKTNEWYELSKKDDTMYLG